MAALKKLANGCVVAMLGSLCISLSACGASSCGGNDEDKSGNYDGFFAAENANFVLTEDYLVTSEDVKGTGGTDSVSLPACTFDLGGHTLDLGGYGLNIIASGAETITFKNGSVTNGKLNISAPEGDISFSGTTMTDSVVCELEAAGDTIEVVRSSVYGDCTVKSQSAVTVDNSYVENILLSDSARLVADNNSVLKSVSVSESASDAQMSITPSVRVENITLGGSAKAEIAGVVGSVAVSESANSASKQPQIAVLPTAKTDTIKLDAAASVNIQGAVSFLETTDAVKSLSDISVAMTGNVTQIYLNSAAEVAVDGQVNSLIVGNSATDSAEDISITTGNMSRAEWMELYSAVSLNIGRTTEGVLIGRNAEGTSVEVTSSAILGYIAVMADNVTIRSDVSSYLPVYATDGIDTSDIHTYDITVLDEEDMLRFATHEHVFTVKSRTASTCTQEGVIIERCLCGEERQTKIALSEHEYEYSVIKEPTASENGRGKYTCIHCGEFKEVEIKPRASITIDGLNELYALIPDGVYTFSGDTSDPLTIDKNGDISLIDSLQATVKVEGGVVSATIVGHVEVKFKDGTFGEYDFKAISDGETFNIYYLYSDADTDELEGKLFTHYTMSGIIKELLSIAAPYDVDEFYRNYVLIIKSIEGTQAGTFIEDIVRDLIISSCDAEQDGNGNTVYNLKSQKLYTVLEEFGNKKLNEVVDGQFGSGSSEKLKKYLSELSDKKTSVIADDVIAFAEKYEIDKATLFALAENILMTYTDAEIDFEVLVALYGDMTADAAVSAYLKDYMNIAYSKEDVAYLLFEGANNVSMFLDQCVYEVLSYNNFPSQAFDYLSMLQIIEEYGENAKLTFTLDAEGNLAAYEMSLCVDIVGEDEIKTAVEVFSSSWKKGDVLPDISYNYEGIELSVETYEDGGTGIFVSMSGYEYSCLIKRTDTGASLEVDACTSGGGKPLLDLDIVYKGDKEGGKIDIGGTADGELFGSTWSGQKINIGGTIIAEKDASALIDESIRDEFVGFEEIFNSCDITFKQYMMYDATTVRLEYLVDDDGEYYRVTGSRFTPRFKSTFTMNGVTYYIGELERHDDIIEVLSVDGLPEIRLSRSDDCGDWVYLSMFVLGNADIRITVTNGVFTVDKSGVYSIVRKDSEDVTWMDGNTVSSSGNRVSLSGYVYYNTVTGETSWETAHTYEYSARLAEGSASCEDGLKVRATCSQCGAGYEIDHTGHYAVDSEEREVATQCGSFSLRRSECLACGDEFIYSDYYNHSITNEQYEILTGERYQQEYEIRYSMLYAQYYTMYQSQGHSVAEADRLANKDARRDAESYVQKNFITADELKEYGVDISGFSYGSLMITTCNKCGIRLRQYLYYANASGEADGCMKYNLYAVEYPGNEDFEGVEFTMSAGEHSHATSMDTEDGSSLEDAVKEAEKYFGKLPLEAESCSVMNEKCLSCGFVSHRIIRLTLSGGSAEFEIIYNAAGEATSVKYDITIYDLDYINSYIDEYLSEYYSNSIVADYGQLNFSYSIDDDGAGNDELWLSLQGGGNTVNLTKNLRIYDGAVTGGTISVNVYNYDQCMKIDDLYNYIDGKWVLSNHSETPYHSFENVTLYFENCSEDGQTGISRCMSCGYEYGGLYYVYSGHYNTSSGGQTDAADEICKHMAYGDISGLVADVRYNSICLNCDTLIDVTITLKADWKLSGDVTLMAEGITIDLNGYNIDLNGHILTVYSYAGNSLTVTDGTFKPSAIEGYDPDTFTDYPTAISDTSGGGLFVACTNGIYVDIGTIRVDCDNLITSKYNRFMLYNYLVSQGYQADEAIASSTAYRDVTEEVYTCIGGDEIKYYELAWGENFNYDAANGQITAEGYLEFSAICAFVTLGNGDKLDISFKSDDDCLRIYVDNRLDGYFSEDGVFTYTAHSYFERTYKVIILFEGAFEGDKCMIDGINLTRADAAQT